MRCYECLSPEMDFRNAHQERYTTIIEWNDDRVLTNKAHRYPLTVHRFPVGNDCNSIEQGALSVRSIFEGHGERVWQVSTFSRVARVDRRCGPLLRCGRA